MTIFTVVPTNYVRVRIPLGLYDTVYGPGRGLRCAQLCTMHTYVYTYLYRCVTGSGPSIVVLLA